MAELRVDVLMSDESVGILKAAVRNGRIATLRELAADLTARADVLEAVGAVDVAVKVEPAVEFDG